MCQKNYILQIGILVAGGYSEGRFTMFYPFSPAYVRGSININQQNLTIGTDEGWTESGWLPDDRKVRNIFNRGILEEGFVLTVFL